MTLLITIFFISIISAFVVVYYSAWEFKMGLKTTENKIPTLTVSGRKIEKYMLYSLKHIVQAIVLSTVKYWLICVAKSRKWIVEHWPRMNAKVKNEGENQQPPSYIKTFTKRAVNELKFKIKRVKQKVKEDHGVEDSSTEE